MKRKFTILSAAIALLACLAVPLGMWGQTTYEQLTSIANIDENAQYVLGIDETGFHYSGTSNWGLTALPSAQTPIYYTLTKATDGNSFTAKATISGTLYYLQVPTSNTFSMATTAGTNTDLIIGTTQVSGTNYAVANKSNTNRHLRLNGASGLRSYANTTGTMAYFYKVVVPSGNTYTVTYHANVTGITDIVETYNEGDDVTVAANTFSNPGYAFTKWNTNAGGTGTDYLPGAVIEDIDDDWDFYAQWQESNESIATLTASALGLSGTSYQSGTKTIDGIEYSFVDLMPSSGNIQAKATTGAITNATAYPGDIISVVITHSGTARATTINGSADGTTWTQVETGSGSITADFSGLGFKYFQITRGSNAAYWTKVEITYSTSGSSQSQSDLTITNASTDLTFDLYNNATAQVINYTTSSTGAITISPASPTSYFSYVHDATAKTITVTPLAVTPNAQTVTIDQEADGDYYAGTATFTVSVANSTPLANIAALTSQTAGNYNVALSNAVVTYVNGSNAYIQDASGAVAMHKSDHGLTAGDVLNGTATVAYQLYNGNPQITNLTGVTPVSGTAPNPTEVAQSAWNYTFSNVLSQYFRVTGATITQSNNKYYVSLGGESIQLYKASGSISTLDLTKTYSITGFPTLYNSTKELTIYADPEVETSTEPSVTVTPSTINAPAEGATGTLALTYENITNFSSFDYNFCDAEGNDLQENPNWIDAEINEENDTYSLYYLIDPNEGEARTAYMKVYTFDDAEEEVYAIVTVNQAEYVVDYATLPFEWEEGDYGTTPAGITNSGVSTGSGDAYLKFDGSGDYIILKINERPGELSFEIKANPSDNTWDGTFKVQASENGTNYTDVLVYNGDNMLDLSEYQEVSLSTLGANIRYIKWVYIEKVKGNVALKNIVLDEYQAPQPAITLSTYAISATNEETDGTVTVTYTNVESSVAEVVICDANGNETTYDWFDADFDNDYNVYYTIDENNGAARTAYFKVYSVDAELNDDVYSDLVTVSQAAAPQQYTLTVNSFENLELITFVDNAMVMEGAGNIQVTEGAQIMLSVVANEGYVMETLMVNGVNHVNDIAADFTYEFDMPGENVTISATAVEAPVVATYSLVTSASQLVAGKSYIIVASNNDGNYYAMGSYYNGYRQSTQVTHNSDNTITGNDNVREVVLGGSTGNWTFYESTVNAYLQATMPDTHGLENSSPLTDACKWTITMDENFAKIKSSNYTSTDWYIMFNSSSPRFACYAGTQKYTYLYERVYTKEILPEQWYLIASPVGDVNITNVGNLTSGNHGLYSFDQTGGDDGKEWRNYKADDDFTQLKAGTGYLYNSESGCTLTFPGTAYTGTGTFQLDYSSSTGITESFRGLNLVGNPYNAMATIDRDYYIMNANGTDLAPYTSDDIVPAMQGVFVKATEEGQYVTFTPNQSTTGGKGIEINLSQNRGTIVDRAIVRFGEGSQLSKVQLFENSTKLYIPQNGKDYAIVSAEGQGELPVNFRASENGTYTLSIDAEDMDMNYLHLIDNMTGMDVDLLQTPSYTFEANVNDYESRFRLVFAGASEGSTTDESFAFYSNGNLIVNNEGNATLQVIDLTGRILSSETVNGSVSKTINAVPGVYMLRLINGDNVNVQKIVVR